MSCLSFFLKTGVTFANFHKMGKLDVLRMLLNINLRGKTRESSQRRIICPVITSGPLDLFGSIFLRCVIISSFANLMVERKLFVRGTKAGKVLSFILGLHWSEKKSLKSLAFSLQSITNLSLTFSGGTLGAFDLF